MQKTNEEKDRIGCPGCKKFLAEIRPPAPPGTKITCYCRQCRKNIEAEKIDGKIKAKILK